MAKHKLSAARVQNAKAGKHEDGEGLRLVVSKQLTRRWVLRYTLHGKRHEMGLGGLNKVSLKDARDAAEKFTKLALNGNDPRHTRNKESVKPPTFAECAKSLIDSKRPEWKNAKHAQQWENTLKDYVSSKIGTTPINMISTDDVLNCLKPIWHTRTETASRVRSRMENVIDYATAHEFREGPNPARWRGHLDKLLPSPKKIAKPVHQPAMPIDKLADFYNELTTTNGVSASALQFLILTGTRSSETLNAQWCEIDGDLWTIPADRMKAGKEHRVPLTPESLAILKSLRPLSDQYVFKGNGDKPLSNMSMLQLMRRMGYGNEGKKGKAVPHGFRSTFRDWCSEHTNYPRDACEMALAHTVIDKTEAAYRRGDMLDIRRAMMSDWSGFVIKCPA